jgi:membrane protease YdiL (CAAX protease family)
VRGEAQDTRSAGIEGWSRASFTARLPAIALVAAVGLGAVVRPLAPFVFVGVLFLYLVVRRFDRPSTALAAVLPAAAILAWRSLPQPIADPGGGQCTDLLAPPAVWRLLEGLVALVAIVALLVTRRSSPAELGLRRASRPVFLVSLAGLLLVGPLAVYGGVLLGGSTFGGMFFGNYTLDLSQPLALAPALLFAASNALAEELAYRGAMRVWLAPGLGIVGANLAQAIVFGLSHTGDDFVGPVWPTMAAMVLVGFVGGVLARRTRSLTLPVAIHAAADIPIYFYWACRLA